MRFAPVFVLPVLAVGLLAGCATTQVPSADVTASSSPSDPTESPTPTGGSPDEVFAPGAPDGQCAAVNLDVTIEGADGAAGSTYYRVVFTNSGQECVLQGFPTVAISGLGNGTQMGVKADELDESSPVIVTLATGGSAVAPLQAITIDPGGGPLGASCTVGNGDGYTVSPPHSYEQLFVEAPGVPACTNGIPWMKVGVVAAG